MGTFHETTLSTQSMTASELDRIAMESAGVVGSIGYGFATPGEVGSLPGGWSARWIDSRGMGNHGTLVLVPTDERTRALAREGKIRAFERAGLTREQAERLQRARARYKFELARVLAAVLSDAVMTRALLAHPGTYGPGSGRGEWRAAWGGALSADVAGLSASREAALAEMVRAVHAGSRPS